ncbi:MAG TPA: AAA family ATPase [Erysipelotrichaceae bacterium]|nr:AAA family ATPase [Erysipelotrichaceae bacterium]
MDIKFDGKKKEYVLGSTTYTKAAFIAYIQSDMLQNALETEPTTLQVSDTRVNGGINKIYYGAPGCGKSFLVQNLLDKAHVKKENRIRVTFHPEYSNTDFIGQILPTIEEVPNSDGSKKEIVKYVFNPGPFTLALKRALETNDMVYLIVEEINRGNAAAIFGDLFQLLDRVKDNSKPNYSFSEYPICNVNIQKYIKDELGLTDYDEVVIPSNLTILATMNSSDQNVFTLDTAFKRRWTFEQISNDIVKDSNHSYKNWYVPGTDVTWSTFLVKLNDKILDYKIHNQTNEDKRLGKYFVTKDCLTEKVEKIADVKETAENFAYKVLEYIWNDVCKIGREEWFDTLTYKTLEDLIAAFIEPDEASGKTPLSVFLNISF